MTKNKLSNVTRNDRGFTIIELIIATAISSGAILLLILGFLSMSRSYTKGLTVAETQNVARSVINTISQSIQFGDRGTFYSGIVLPNPSNPSQNPSGWFCSNNTIFAYTLAQEVVTNSADALVEYPTPYCPTTNGTPPGASCTVIAANCYLGVSGAKELLGPKMRLTAINILPQSDNTYLVSIRIVYGDDSYLQPVSYNGSNYYYDGLNSGLVNCVGTASIDYCAVSSLQTVVGARLAN